MDEHPKHAFTDHRNVLYVFSPLSIEHFLGRHIVSKVQRWSLFLSTLDYTIENVDGSKNVFADFLTSLAGGYRSEIILTSCVFSMVLKYKLLPAAAAI